MALTQEPSTAGSPAHAGIDPCGNAAGLVRDWFPRTRGDRPGKVLTEEKGNAVPPHTRG